MNRPEISESRLWARTEALARHTRPDLPWTRRAFGPEFAEGRQWLRREMEAAGLTVRVDSGGNLIGRREGSNPNLKPLVTGSHCDTVVSGGRYDGIIGVLAGIEIAHALQQAGTRWHHPFEVVDFLSEEPSDYGISCVGSRSWCGRLDAAMLAARNPDGETLADGMRRIGADPDRLDTAMRGTDGTAAFVELHIEQGPVLEAEGLPIGVVTHIVGIRRVRIVVDGRADHAGTTPMDIRCDALVGASRIIDAAHQRASRLSGQPHYVVATVGRIGMQPNVPNAVPARVEMILEVRSDDVDTLATFPETILAELAPALASLRVTAQLENLTHTTPTACQPLVMEAIERCAGALGHAHRRMPSGAGHDAVYVAPTGPIGMVFIPCLAGRSHCPEESITPAQLKTGTEVLMATLADLDHHLGAPDAASARHHR